MAEKHTFGEYSAYMTPGGIRFQKYSRLVSEKSIPVEVVSFLKNKFGDDSGKVKEEPKFPRPSEEELAKMRAESVQVKPELQMSPEEIEARTPEPISEEDFDNPTPKHVEQADTAPTAEQMHAVSEVLNQGHAQAVGGVDSDFLESVSIHTADLKDIAQAIYERFGIYTVYLRKLPEIDEVNPLTGVSFTKYHLGTAYQAAIYANNQGHLDMEPERHRKQLDESRLAHENFRVDPVNHTLAEARRANDFNFRTSVQATESVPTTTVEHVKGEDGQIHAVQVPIPEHGNLNGVRQRYDASEEEQIVEPPIIGGKPIIRPNW